ncbi:MAG: signal peptidase I [Pseudomonadota bacterium]
MDSKPARSIRLARSGQSIWQEWRGFVLFLLVLLLFRSAVADWNQVPTGSMQPSILIGDRIGVDKLAYDLRVPFTLTRIARWSHPARSDVVTFEGGDGRLLVKRVIGIPGDVVTLQNNKLVINGEPAQYETAGQADIPNALQRLHKRTHVNHEQLLGASRMIMTHRFGHPDVSSSFGPVTVPADHYLLLGDNRDKSQDYRSFDFIHRKFILGKANRIVFSLDYQNFYLPRSERFLQPLI